MKQKLLLAGSLLLALLLTACAQKIPSAVLEVSESSSTVSSSEPEKSDSKEPVSLIQAEDALAEEDSSAEPEEAAGDLFVAERAEAQQLLTEMSVEEKVWQLFLTAIPKGADAAAFAQSCPAGGYLLFKWDFADLDADGVREKMTDLSKGKTVPLLAVDEEGGDIVRISCYPALRSERFPSPRTLWQWGEEAVYSDGFEKGVFLSELGLNLCLSPVADVSEDPNDYIYARTIGENAEATGKYVSAAVQGMQQGGIGAVLKHFPGYGNNCNTHTGIAVDERPLEQFIESDLVPFAAGIEAGVGAVLVSHNIVSAFDSLHPASLSAEVHRYLREEMGFTGLIMTDDLIMEAITDYTGDQPASVAALLAGNDLLIHSNAAEGVQEVLDALEDGTLSMEMIDCAAEQVLAYKLWRGIL